MTYCCKGHTGAVVGGSVEDMEGCGTECWVCPVEKSQSRRERYTRGCDTAAVTVFAAEGGVGGVDVVAAVAAF